MNLNKLVSVYPQYILPQHLLSQWLSRITHAQTPWLKNLFIRQITRWYGVDLSEAEHPDAEAYASFNAFFTRALNHQARPWPAEQDTILSPADGVISQIGNIAQGRIIQAKHHHYTVTELLGGNEQHAKAFDNGLFATIYLSPRDYHRLHMPVTGRLKEMIHVPGRLFSVNTATTDTVARLFARNERVVCLFETDLGSMALVLVGAIFVSSIETVWHGVVTPPTRAKPRVWHYDAGQAPVIERGQEMGRFNMGSTIIALFPQSTLKWTQDCRAGHAIKLRQTLGIPI
ncbi:MAG: archaetidylserine decarboxylase [Methylococcales bacterium]|nr:archaetidylserine decarboxylase [Methylococcales bacterium]